MVVLANDTFTRANQSGWGLASDGINTWSLVRGSTTLAIVSNQGSDTGNSGSFAIAQCGVLTSADTEQVVTFKRSNAADVTGAVSRYLNNSNWYSINIGEFANNLVFAKMVAGVYTDVAFGPSVTPVIADTYSIRFRNVGTGILARMWDTAGSEPVTWDINTTDTSLSTAGSFGVVTDPFSAAILYSAYNVTDGTSAPTNNAMSSTDSATASDTLAGVGVDTNTDIATASDTLAGVGVATVSDSVTASDSLLGGGSNTSTDSTTATDSLSGTLQSLLTDASTASDTFNSVLSAQLLDILAAFDLSSAISTPASVILATTLITANFRSGLVHASFRDGQGQATFRDGLIEEEAR